MATTNRRSRWMLAAIFGLVLLAVPASSFGGVFISVGIAPPALPVYAQPLCPGADFIWTPGYWAYGGTGFYWVPGVWIRAPFVGGLWTPGYWGWSAGLYYWHPGYWGHHIGFYGGVNYGFGYGGVGYTGGYWHNGVFAYNRTVSHVDVTRIHNTYSKTVVNNNASRTSYNGGTGGIHAEPNGAERAAEHEQHTAATARQAQHERAASANRAASAHRASSGHTGRGGAASHHATAAHSAAHRGSTHASNHASHNSGGGRAHTASHASGGGHASKGGRRG